MRHIGAKKWSKIGCYKKMLYICVLEHKYNIYIPQTYKEAPG